MLVLVRVRSECGTEELSVGFQMRLSSFIVSFYQVIKTALFYSPFHLLRFSARRSRVHFMSAYVTINIIICYFQSDCKRTIKSSILNDVS